MSDLGQQTTANDSRSVGYDPAFRAAVEAGLMTPRQALQRGRRSACASGLSAKHGLTLELALAVADNRLRLSQAIDKQRSPVGEPGAQSESKRSVATAVVALGVPLTLFVAAFGWNLWRTPPSIGPGSLASARISMDTAGRVTQVAADDPTGVLEAFCEATRMDTPCRPAGLMKAVLEAPRLRVGILADPLAADNLLAIPIRQDRETGRWSAGDGNSPLVGLLPPDNAASSLERSPNYHIPVQGP